MQFITHLAVVTLGMGVISLSLLLIVARADASNTIIAFTSDRNGNWDIYLMDIEHNLLYNLTRQGSDALGPVWSSLNGQLAFYTDTNNDGADEIFTVNIDGTELQPVVIGQGNYWRPQWSPDGTQLVLIRNYGNIRIVDSTGANEYGLTYGFGPVWSPTAARIAYYADHPGDLNADIYLIDADGRNLRNLTQHRANDWDPAWSPDGQHLAFVSSRDGNAELYVVDTTCEMNCLGDTQRLTLNAYTDRSPAWSPDGRQIIFESEVNGISQIFVINADGTELHQLTSGRSPIWLDLFDR